MQDLLWQHEEQQSCEVAWLQQEMEQRSQEPHGLAHQGVLLAACQHWGFWVTAETLLLLFGLYWLPRHKGANPDSDNQQQCSSGAEEDEEEEEWEKKPDPHDTLGQDKSKEKMRASSASAKSFLGTTF